MAQPIIHKCGAFCRRPFVAFLIGTTVSFPIEHGLYKYVWPFSVIGQWFGL